MAFLLFFGIVLGIYFLANYYVFMRGLQAMPASGTIRTVYISVFWILAGTYVAGRFIERVYLSHFSDLLIWTGSFWLGALLYFFLLVVFFDLLRWSNNLLPWFPRFVTNHWPETKKVLLLFSVILVALVVFAGHINTRFPVIRKVDIHIDKQAGTMSGIDAVLLSDIHLGTLIGNGQFVRIVDRVLSLEPDIILLAGDVLDEDLEPVIRQNIGKTLSRLEAPLGVWAVIGNHEHIGGSVAAQNYLEQHGIKILRDSVVKISNSFFLVGRDDRDKKRFTGRERMSLEDLLHDIDFSHPIILMDHQPFYLEKAAALGVDLQVSGHTHHGQMWPFNYITRGMYTISHGYGNVNGMHAYVSNGVGTWGPPIRIGNRPEIVKLNIRFRKQ